MAFSVRRTVAVGSAILIWIAALLQILQGTGATGEFVPPPSMNGTDWEANKTLRAIEWKKHMDYEYEQLVVNIFIGMFFSSGTFGLAYCVLCLKKIFKKYNGGKSDLPDLMLMCFVFGSLMLVYEFVASLGSEITIVFLSRASLRQMDSMSVEKFESIAESIEVSDTILGGRKIIIFALLFILVSVGVAIASNLSLKTGILNAKHAKLGILTAISGFLCFIAEIVLLSSFYFETTTNAHAAPFGILMVVFGLVLMPIWTVWLGFELARIKEDVVFKVQSSGLVNSEDNI